MQRNRIVLVSAVMAGVLILASLAAVGGGQNSPWNTDFGQAVADSQQSGRPLLLHFHAKWCPPCRQMDKSVLNESEVEDMLANHFVAVKVDSNIHPDLVTKYKVQQLPTDIVLAPNGVELLKSEGYHDKGSYLKQLRKIIQRTDSNPEAPTDRSADERLARKDDATKPLIGLERYSPVYLGKTHQWRKGKSQYALVYQGVVYLMCDEEEYRDFQSNPTKYVPRLLGCDPVVLWSSDRAVPGTTQFGAFYDEDLFLFSSAENRDRFKNSPTLYSRTQHVLKADQIDGPRWR